MSSRSCWRRSTDPPPCAAPAVHLTSLARLSARMSKRVRAFRRNSNHAHSVPLVSSSARRSRERRKRALLHALRLPLLRARKARARCQSACREIAAQKDTSRRTRGVGLVVLPLPCASKCAIAALCVGGPRLHRRGKEIERWRGPPPTACACPPTRPQRALWESCISYWAWASSLRQ